jgi:hypothetical protein
LPWPKELEDTLKRVKAVAIFIGDELGTWQKRELWFALDRQAREEKEGKSFPVIPILLPDGDPAVGFLSLNTWIDLRVASLAEAVDTLSRSIGGRVGNGRIRKSSTICPYRALDAFKEEHAAFFFGRENVLAVCSRKR